MNKNKLESFIKRYYLGGSNEAVSIVSDGKDLTTSFITDDKTLMGSIVGKSFNLDEFTIGVNDTSKLRNMLGILSDDIKFSVHEEDKKSLGIKLTDKTTDVYFTLADLSAIPSVPKIKEPLPDMNVELIFNKEFISRFIKAKGALPDVDTFTLLMDKKKKLQFVIGYVKGINSNCISLEVETEKDKDVVSRNISFSAKYLKEVLVANSEVDECRLYVSEKGFAKIELNHGDFETKYFMTEKKVD